MKKLTVYSVVLAIVVMGFGLTANAGVLVADDFNRPYNNTLGTMSDGVHKWLEYEATDSHVRANGTAAYISYGAPVYVPGIAVTNSDDSAYTLADGIMKATCVYQSRYYYATISYRAASLVATVGFNTADTYHLVLNSDWSGNSDIKLMYGSTQLGSANLGTTWAATAYEIHFEGTSHKVYVNGGANPVIDVTDTNKTGAGCIGLGTYSSTVVFDDFEVSTIPEPATMSLLLLGLPFVLRRRKK